MRTTDIERELNKLRRAHLDARAEIASVRFEIALRKATVEAKYNFDPSQPRAPRGSSDGGQWVQSGAGGVDRARYAYRPKLIPVRAEEADRFVPVRAEASIEVVWEPIATEAAKISRQVGEFVERNRDPITRFLGAVQAIGGAVEMGGGAGAVTGGVATSEIGVGVAVAGMGAWMVTNGYDNFTTGLQVLMTGKPHDTRLHEALRSFGLSEQEAMFAEIALADGVTVGASKLTRSALENAAKVGLAKRAADTWAHDPLNVKVGSRPIFLEQNIVKRGEAWEDFDSFRTGIKKTPRGFPVFDQFDNASGTAISNKTLDLTGTSYSVVDRTKVYERIRDYVDATVNFKQAQRPGFKLTKDKIKARRLHMLLPTGEALPGQALQLEAASAYAASRGVVLQVEYAR
jgi:hypothetical protein